MYVSVNKITLSSYVIFTMLNCESSLSSTVVKANVNGTKHNFCLQTQHFICIICIKLLARNLPNL